MIDGKDQKARDKFARKLIAAMHQNGAFPNLDAVKYCADEFQLQLENSVWNLGNFYAEYRRHGFFSRGKALSALAMQLTAIGTLAAQVPNDFAAALPQILPRLRERMYWDVAGRRLRQMQQATSAVNSGDVAVQPQANIIYDVLTLEFVIDTPQMMMTIPPNRFATWGKSFDEILPLAIQNLQKRSAKAFERSANGLYSGGWHDSHDASRLLLLDLIRAIPVQGHHLAMVTNCNLLMVADSNNDSALSEMAARARVMMEEPRFMTSTVFRLVGDTWQPHEFASSHPLKASFEAIQKLELAQNYAAQKEDLQLEVGDELRVSAQKAFKLIDDDTMYLYATWTKTVPQALPQSDFIMLCDLDEPNSVIKVSWQDLIDVAGSLLHPMGTFPERYRVEQFPNAQQLAQLQRRANARDSE